LNKEIDGHDGTIDCVEGLVQMDDSVIEILDGMRQGILRQNGERIGELAHLAMQLPVADELLLVGLVALPDDRGLFAAAGQMAVDAVVRDIELPAFEPAHFGAGEIARSVAAARPDIALITNASVNHAEGFGGLEGVVRAKGEIIDGLKPDGVLLLNAADPRVGDWRRRGADFRQVLFSLHERPGESGYCAAGIELNNAGQPSFELVSPRGMVRVGLRLLGEHNVANAVAAAAAAFEAGAGAEAVKQGLEAVEPVPGRLCPQAGPGGLRIIDDSYNAAPGSFRAAIELLARLPGESLLIAGDMLELGPGTEAMHREIGSYAAARGIGQLWATGELCRHMVKGFGHAGRHFATRQQLLEALDEVAAADRVVLVKGSRGARMDEVTAILQKGGTD